jgi:hypothetical protein
MKKIGILFGMENSFPGSLALATLAKAALN